MVETRVSKEIKLIFALQPVYESAKVFHKTVHTDLETELLTLPKQKTDDIMDAEYLAFGYTMAPKGILDKNGVVKKPTTRPAYNWKTGRPLSDKRASAIESLERIDAV